MTDWAKDLQDLLGGIGGGIGQAAEYTPITAPINDIAAGKYGNIPGEVAGGLFRGLSVPQDVVKWGTGGIIGGINEGLRVLDEHGVPVAGWAYEPDTHKALMQGGPRQVWEQVRSEEPAWFQVPTEIGIDPLTWLGTPVARGSEVTKLGNISHAFESAASAPKNPVAGLVAGAGADLTRGADVLFNKAPWFLADKTVGTAGRIGKKAILKRYPTAFDLTPKAQYLKDKSEIGGAWINSVRAKAGLPGLPAVIPGTTKSLSPFDQYDVPPFWGMEFDAGVPKRIQAMAWDSWQRLKMSHPGIPGVNEAGITPAQPGQATFLQGQRPGEGGGILGRLRNAANGPLGYIPPPPGGYQDPGQVRIDEDNLREMATIAAGIMMSYDNDASNRLFGRLVQASRGVDDVKKAITQIYGTGINPFIPGMYDEMLRQVREQGGHLPDIRFFSEWGWPEGSVSTARLDDLQRKIDSGLMKPEDAINELFTTGFHAGSNEAMQATEHAAAMGAGYLGATRNMDTAEAAQHLYNPFEGQFRPTGIDPNTGRAAVPSGFEAVNQFDKNASGYTAYVTQLFGPMPQQQVEAMRKMSVELIYNELLNSASPVSADATEFLRKGRPYDVIKESINQKTGKVTRTTTTQYGPGASKLGGYADPNDPRQIGNRIDEIAGFGDEVKYVTGKATLRSLNSAYLRNTLKTNVTKEEYKEVTGKIAKGRDLNNDQIVEMIVAKGGTPFIENRVGGPLPNAQKLVDMFQASKDLPVGSYPAPEFYDAAAEEILNIVGPGRYEDAMMLVELLGITSASEGVEKNANNALKLFAEWKVGSPEFAARLQHDYGLTPDQVMSLLKNDAGEWTDPQQIFRKGMTAGMRDLTTKAFNEYVARREAGGVWKSVQGGPKTHSYAGSTLINVWRDAIDYALADNPKLHKTVKDALDKAVKASAWDRHMSRVVEQGTNVSPIQASAMRELGLIASDMAGASPERFQSGLWYLIKDQQGFTRVTREDDVAMALRRAWQKNLDPARQADVRDMVDRIFPGLKEQDPEEFDNQIDELMRQEGIYATIEKALDGHEKELQKATGESKPLKALMGLGDDVVGIVNRANAGAPPHRTPNAIQLQDVASSMLGQISQGKEFGATFGWDGQNWVPEQPPSGFAVALTSAGKSVSTSKVKTSQRDIEKMILSYRNIFDDPRYSDKLKFGVFDMEDPVAGKAASFDLTLVVPDERQAVSLAKQFNQKAIYDFGTGRLIETGGTGDPVKLGEGELKSIIDSIYGKPGRQFHDPRDVMKRGIGIAEMDQVNPVSILNRRVLGPIMEQFHSKSVSGLPGSDSASHIPGDALGLPGPVPEDTVFDFSSIGQRPEISTQENMILGQTFDNGERYGDRLDRYHEEAKQDQALIDASGVKWKGSAGPKQRLAMVEGDETLKKIVQKYNDAGNIDIASARPEDIAVERFGQDLAKTRGVEPGRNTAYDLLKAAWGEQALASIKYHTGNIQGAWMQNALGGHFTMPGPDQFARALKFVRSGRDEVSRQEALNGLHVAQTFQKWGFDDIPTWLTKGGVRGMTGEGGRSATGRLVTKVTKNEALGSKVGTPFEYNADMSSAVELVMRGTLAEDVLEREMTKAMPRFEASVNRMAEKQGLEGFEFSILDTINPVPGGPNPARLRDHLKRLGFNDGYAERASRNFAEAKNAAEKAAKAEVEKRQFSYDRTNLDEFVGKFVPFHYWYSRALRYYGEESLRHPYIILNYMRSQEGIDDAQNDPGLSARQKGFLKLMGTPLGFTLLMNPEAMFGVVKVFGLDTYEDPNDTEISAGKVLRFLQDRGLGLYPWIEGTLNLMGVMGDTYEPDLIGIRNKALIGAAVNFMRSQLGLEPAGAPYAAAMGQLRGDISGFVSRFTPDWLTQPVQARSGGSLTEASMDTVIESRVKARNPNLTNGELLDIMSDPDSPEYVAAYRDAAANGLVQQLLNFTLPQNYKLKENTRDVRAAQSSTIYEAAEKQGVSPYEFKPTVGDTSFAARYEQLTGKTWQPGDYKDAQTVRELTEAVPEAKPLAYQAAEYNNLGTPLQQRRFSSYQDILNGNSPQTASLDYQTRRELANAWASKLGYTNDIADVYRLRDAWEQSHPEFAAFKGWQSQMFDLKNHLGGSLAEYRRQASQQNPNAARYFADAEDRIRARGTPLDDMGVELDKATVSVDAYTAIHGMPVSRYDQGPIPGVPPVDVTLPSVQAQLENQQPNYPYSTDWLSSLRSVSPGYGTDTYGTWWNH